MGEKKKKEVYIRREKQFDGFAGFRTPEGVTVPVPKRCATVFCLGKLRPRDKYCSKCMMSRWKKKNPLKYTYSKLKNNAKRRGIPFLLTLEDWEVWCGLTGYLELRGIDGDSMTVDRIIDYDESGNKMPYRYDNIQMLTLRDNRTKPKKHKPYEKQEGDPF